MQSNIVVGKSSISGTLKYVTGYTEFSGEPELQEGHFLALNIKDSDFTGLTSVTGAIVPSATGSDPAEMINDEDKNIVFYVSDKDAQHIEFVSTDGTNTRTQKYDISGLTLEPEGEG